MRADEALKKWKNLRDHFVRELKKVKKRPSGEEGPPYVSKWAYYEVMNFITDTVRHRE